MANEKYTSNWNDEDTYWRENFRNRPYASQDYDYYPRASATATKRRANTRTATGTMSNPTLQWGGTTTSIVATRPGKM